MSLSNLTRISLNLPNVDVFTFGESTLYGYDSLNHCLIVVSLNELNQINDQSINHLYLSLSPTNPIRQLILNQDETILALISDKTCFLVYLPQPLKGSRQCPVNVLPSSSSLNNNIIDFLWLSPIHLMIVNSHPSSSECHLYLVRPSKSNGIEHLQTFSIGTSTLKGKTSETPNKKISLHQPSNIVKLDLVKRKQDDSLLILVFALKADGDIFLMEIDQNELISNESQLSSSFIGPIRIIPSTFDNYGADYSHSRLLCLSNFESIIVLFTRSKCEINQCIYLNPLLNDYYLYTIDSITLPTTENTQIIKSMIIDKLNSNIYYILDSLSNIYSIEIFWINQIKKITKTNIQHIIKSNDFIYQIGLIQTNSKGQCLAIISRTSNHHLKELIFLRPHSLSSSTSIQPRPSLPTIRLNPSSEFLDRIRSILSRDRSLPQLILSSASSATNISGYDFERNLLLFIEIFSEEYFFKQEKARIELENKQRYLHDFQQTQIIAQQELEQKLQQIQQIFQHLNQQYQKESSRRKDLSSNVDDHLSIIEQHTPVVSDAEMLMHQQLMKYDIQINSLKEKISLLKQYITTEKDFNRNQQQIDQSAINNFQAFAQYFRTQIDQMKQQIQTVNQDN